MIEEIISKVDKNENCIYIYQPDTVSISNGLINYIYDIAFFLNKNNYNVTIFYNKQKPSDLGKYKDLNIFAYNELIKTKSVSAADFFIIPEEFFEAVKEFRETKLPCEIIILNTDYNKTFNQFEYNDLYIKYGVNNNISICENLSISLKSFFPENNFHTLYPHIPKYFLHEKDKLFPYIALFGRDERKIDNFIKKFYIKYPHLSWITFKNIKGLSRNIYAKELEECIIGVWLDTDNTYSNIPLEIISNNMFLLGESLTYMPNWINAEQKIPAIWDNCDNLIIHLENYITKWLNDDNFFDDDYDIEIDYFIKKYSIEKFENNLLKIFNDIKLNRIEKLTKFKKQQENNEK